MKKYISLFLVFLLTQMGSVYSEHFLTFIIPCYNCEKWIEETVDSIFQQKNLPCPFEVVCTDDASKDNTLNILHDIASKHPEIKVVRHRKNRGGGAARNTCVANSQGDIIFCLDSDNVLIPNSVSKLIEHMDETGYHTVAFGEVRYFVKNFKPNGSTIYDAPDQKYRLYDMFQTTNFPGCSGNYLFTRESFDAVGGYSERWGALDTLAFGFNKLLHGFAITYVPNTYYLHRQGIDSYWMRDAKSNKVSINFYNLMMEHAFLFTDASIQCLTEEIKYYERYGKILRDFVWYLENKKFVLKECYYDGKV